MQDLDKLINEKNINGILVDIDGTLYDYEYAHLKSLKLCFKDFMNIKKDISFNDFNDEYRACRNIVTEIFRNQGSARSRLLAFQILFEKYNVNNAYSHALDYEIRYWKYLIKNIKPNFRLIKFLIKSRSKNIKICAVSDMQMRYQVKKLKKLDLENIIQYLVTSEECGFEKPEKLIYEHALKKISTAPHKTVMIGDNISKDIEGAEAQGIHAYFEKFTYKK